MNTYTSKIKEIGPTRRISCTDRHVVVGNEDKKKTSEHLSSFYAHWDMIFREQTYAVRRSQCFNEVITSTGNINEDRACFPGTLTSEPQRRCIQKTSFSLCG